MKYIDADRLKAEIDRLKAETEKRMHICDGIFERDSDTYYQGKAVAYQETLSLIDSLQHEQTEVDLEEEMDRFFEEMSIQEHENIFEDTYQMIARHFYELGLKAKEEKK